MAARRAGKGEAATLAGLGAREQRRPFFRTRQLILRDGDQVHALVLRPWLQKSVVGLLVVGLLWGIGFTLAFWHQAVEADEAAAAYRTAIADMARQQLRIADISRGLAGQRVALDRLLHEGGTPGAAPLHGLEGEIAGMLGQIAELQGTLAGINATLEASIAERRAAAREREAMAARLREVERQGQARTAEAERRGAERAQELERQLAAAQGAHEELLAGLAQRTRATVAEVERILGEAGLEPNRMMPPPAGRQRRSARGGPFVPATAAVAAPAATGAPTLRLREGAQGLHQEVDWLTQLSQLLAATPISVPLAPGYQVESGFGRRADPFGGRAAAHMGIDLSDSHGKPVHATAPGKVTLAGWENGYGRVVEIDHGFGLRTRYAHLASIAVQPDQLVSRFTRIGTLGNSGRSTGSHLHYEVTLHGRHQDPSRFMQGAFTPTTNPGSGSGR